MSLINLKDLTVSYDGKTEILKQLNIDIKKGELVSLLGPSGCGKTTTLRVIAGFIEPVGGKFLFEEEDFTHLPVHKRNFGLVFQSYALFPHLTVSENVAFGLKLRKIPKQERKEQVMEMLEIVGLKEFASRFPKELSGGQRQRVALARALVIKPKLLLLDEPLSNLDAKLRVNMRVEIRRLQQKFGITTVFVTHDQEECFSISDKVAILNGGRIEQYDVPEKIYTYPASEFVARFVGFENFINLKKNDGSYMHIDSGKSFISDYKEKNENKIVATIRPDNIEIVSEDIKEKNNLVNGEVIIRTFLGKGYQYEIHSEVGKLIVNSDTEQKLKNGDKVTLYLPANKLILV